MSQSNEGVLVGKGNDAPKGSLLRMKEKAAQLREQISDIQNGNKPNRKQRKDRNAQHKLSPLSRTCQSPIPCTPTKKILSLTPNEGGGSDSVSGASGVATPAKSEKNSQAASPRLASTSPLPGRRKCPAPGPIPPEVLQQLEMSQLESERWQNELIKAQQEIELRQESYIRRENNLQKVLYGMQLEIDKLKKEDEKKATPGASKMGTFGERQHFIVDVHNQILDGIQNLLDKQKIQMKREEALVLRSFKDRVKALEEDLLTERSSDAKTGDSNWLDKAMQLREELEEMKDMASKLDAKLKESEEHCEVYKLQYKTQIEKEDEILKQTVLIKKENQQLKDEISSLRLELEKLGKERELRATAESQEVKMHKSEESAAVGLAVAKPAEVITALQKRLEEERCRSSQARAAHVCELKRRTDLQSILTQCIQDVRGRRKRLENNTKRASRRPQSAYHSNDRSRTNMQPHLSLNNGFRKQRPVSALASRQQIKQIVDGDEEDVDGILDTDEKERENIIEELMSREDVLKILFQESFADKSAVQESPPPSAAATNTSHRKSWHKGSKAIAFQFLAGK